LIEEISDNRALAFFFLYLRISVSTILNTPHNSPSPSTSSFSGWVNQRHGSQNAYAVIVRVKAWLAGNMAFVADRYSAPYDHFAQMDYPKTRSEGLLIICLMRPVEDLSFCFITASLSIRASQELAAVAPPPFWVSYQLISARCHFSFPLVAAAPPRFDGRSFFFRSRAEWAFGSSRPFKFNDCWPSIDLDCKRNVVFYSDGHGSS